MVCYDLDAFPCQVRSAFICRPCEHQHEQLFVGCVVIAFRRCQLQQEQDRFLLFPSMLGQDGSHSDFGCVHTESVASCGLFAPDLLLS